MLRSCPRQRLAARLFPLSLCYVNKCYEIVKTLAGWESFFPFLCLFLFSPGNFIISFSLHFSVLFFRTVFTSCCIFISVSPLLPLRHDPKTRSSVFCGFPILLVGPKMCHIVIIKFYEPNTRSPAFPWFFSANWKWYCCLNTFPWIWCGLICAFQVRCDFWCCCARRWDTQRCSLGP